MDLVLQTQERKRAEIIGAIKRHEASIAQAKHDLAHVNAAIKILEGADSSRACIVSQGFFAKGEIAEICQRHLAEGPLNTRSLAQRVMCEKGWRFQTSHSATLSSTRWSKRSDTPSDVARCKWWRSGRGFVCGA